jgi:hypothetical protein
LLKQLPLASYYDDVALEGLRLAVIDTERGALTPDHLERIKLCIQSLIEDLDDHEDRQPPIGAAKEADTTPTPSRPDTPVLCIAGRGPLDEAVSTMLAQLRWGTRGLRPGWCRTRRPHGLRSARWT